MASPLEDIEQGSVELEGRGKAIVPRFRHRTAGAISGICADFSSLWASCGW